ncbi:MAG: VWA domain-containing protein, partial [Bacteroidota bacterium]
VTAKGHGTFVKTFKEEKEQTVFFIMDVSSSQEIGSPGKQKADIGKEICGVLSLSAAKEGSQVGLLCYSDQKEKYVKPAKGPKQAYEIIYNLVNLRPNSNKTDLSKAILLTLNTVRRRSVMVFISDFIDEGYFHNLKGMAKKHDLVMIRITDKRETKLPKLGIVPILDKESKKTLWVNTSFGNFRSKLKENYQDNEEQIIQFAKRHQINYVSIDTEEDYVPKLLKLFKIRNKSVKSV